MLTRKKSYTYNNKKSDLISCFLSLIIHIILINVFFQNDINKTKGYKYTPIELINNQKIGGEGEVLKNPTLKKSETLIPKKQYNLTNKSKALEEDGLFKRKESQKKKTQDKKDLPIEKEKDTKNKTDKNAEEKKLGFSRNKDENNSIEKGSIKGQGKIKITCLDCKLPNYPTRALRRGAEGKILIKVWINTRGRVTETLLIKSSGIKSMDLAAINAASNSIFYPIESKTTLNIEYEMKLN